MKKFILKVGMYFALTFITAAVLIGFTFGVVAPQYRLNYNASIGDKMERLENINESKIILVGNSNLPFGIDSEKIEKEIGMPVVNLGLHGGLGNYFHEAMAKEQLKEGDLVVLCHTNYAKSELDEPDIVWQMLEERLDLLKLIRPEDRFKVLRALPGYMQKSFYLWCSGKGNMDTEDGYSRNAFNEYGDNVYPRPECEYEFRSWSVKVPEIDQENVERINALNAFCQEKGATLVIAGYPIGDGERTPEIEKFAEFQQSLEEQMECEVISDFTDYFIEYQYFYDTQFHLTDEGVQIRTDQLIRDIKEWMEENDSMD